VSFLTVLTVLKRRNELWEIVFVKTGHSAAASALCVDTSRNILVIHQRHSSVQPDLIAAYLARIVWIMQDHFQFFGIATWTIPRTTL
jgi:hypothetical protein